MTGIILLRGDTFRGSYKNQMIAYESIINHVIKPCNVKNIHVFICTFFNVKNNKIKDIFIGLFLTIF